jgi:hypothetical protein
LKWSAISAVAGALERKIWVRMNRMNLYPNMYILLIAEPGIGKTVSASQAEILWRGLEEHHVAPTNATKAALIDVLAESQRKIIMPTQSPDFDTFHALNIMAGEFGAFIPMWDNEFIQTLTTLWDGGHYSERKRTGALKIDIPRPLLNMLACATPDFMNNFMPEGAWNQGFASRLMMIFSGQVVLGDLWSEDNHANAMGDHYDKLQSDLKAIGNMYGKMEFTPEAGGTFTDWYKSGMLPVPNHTKLQSYLPRRAVHLAKICMTRAAAQGNMLITLNDYKWSLDTLLEAEYFMPDIFRAMSGGKGQSAAMDEVWRFCFMCWGKEKKPTAQHRLVNFLAERVPSHSILQVLETMVLARMLKEEIGVDGKKAYAPLTKEKQF